MFDIEPGRRATYLVICRVLVVLSAIASLFYLKWLLFDARPDNALLYVLLVGAEVFNIAQAAGFWYTIWSQEWTLPEAVDFSATTETVDVFITVFGEPVDVVERTVAGAMAVRHPRKKVWVLDDGGSPQIAAVAARHGAGYLVRPSRRGAKAGNLNDAMARTTGEFLLVLDADHVPKPEFLELSMGGFGGADVAFVQTPQDYVNRTTNRVSAGANEQQGLFYGPIMRGKNARNAVFSCGTNVIFRRVALESVGGMPEDSITEDLRVSLILSGKGQRGVYVPLILAEGMGPVDVASFFSQQSRWARGGLEIMFKRRPFSGHMSLPTRLQYGLGFMYWFTGWAYAVYLLLPVAYLVFGQRPVQVPNQYPAYFLPYVVMTLVTLAYAAGFRLTFRALWFTLASFPVFIGSFFTALFGRRARFVVTSKGPSQRSLRPVAVQLWVLIALVLAAVFGLLFRGFTPAVTNNVAFVLGHIVIIQGFVRYARRPEEPDHLSADGADALAPPRPAPTAEVASGAMATERPLRGA
jgi:cellulose synthase (UDP-forming)